MMSGNIYSNPINNCSLDLCYESPNQLLKPVADPGFPTGGGANPKGGGAPTYYFANFSQKLHENEEILGQRGAHIPCAPSP